ncbi:hypothetical protein G6F57_003068 [Rhizopus arrhizus]|uniref:Uncharacterized protein n=1 Tax=Rhizopus oryzae TaxID=64495 RepID=A0A9P7BTU2_RHIOR|nr:hypothetical protein G6F23_008944 [Rhizopus arrhizus]KAG1410071.1 hypothetical protein G6F58_009285 [Rhizopus delemar]KAG0768159.1 hypothetical protein G6F24_002186 [Rhizopus arrhizus]KAG0794022.1 hypothetical protein G6F21_003182 [Rhizopus arrhizus]KAG0816120.1 hypothetical protein G6F20_003449 [Rhizopus arrhizus]
MSTKATLKINQLIQERQFYWWLGHVCVVLNGLIYFSSVLSFYLNPIYYKRAYIGVLLSYAIVIYNSIEAQKSIGINLLCDENVHYFVVAFYWFSIPPITATDIIPLFIPKIEKGSLIEKLNNQIKYVTENFHTTAMQFVAYIEVIVIPCRLIIGIILFHTSVLSIIVFVHFLRLRYYLCRYSKDAVQNVTYYLDHWLLSSSSNHNTTWAIISNLYINLKRIMARYGSSHIK